MKHETYHEKLKRIMDEFVHLVYRSTRIFPREELFGVTSQIRRASLSVILNYVEGYARGREKVHKNFLEISYGSLKESAYLLHFSMEEGYLNRENYQKLIKLTDEIGAMLWTTMQKL